MTYSILNKNSSLKYKVVTMNEIMIENCHHIYPMDAANTVKLGSSHYQWPMKICFYYQNTRVCS